MALRFQFRVIDTKGVTVFKAQAKDPLSPLLAGASCIERGVGCEFAYVIDGGQDGFLEIMVSARGDVQFDCFDGNGDGLSPRQETKILNAFDCLEGRRAIGILADARKKTLADNA